MAEGQQNGNDRWQDWCLRQLTLFDGPSRKILAQLPPGPEAASFIQAARYPISPTAAVIREWLEPRDCAWLLIPGVDYSGVAVTGGAILRYPEAYDDDPVALCRVAMEAWRLGRADAACIRKELGIGMTAVLAGAIPPPEAISALSQFRGWYRQAGQPYWAASWDRWLETRDIGANDYAGDPDAVSEARALLAEGLPPHRPPGASFFRASEILLALASWQQEGRRGMESLATKALEGLTLMRLWQEADVHGD